LEKRQNFQFLIQALVEANLNGIELVIVGCNDKKINTVSELGASLRITDRLRLLG
jgi:anti-anti-sigma regulatory factor